MIKGQNVEFVEVQMHWSDRKTHAHTDTDRIALRGPLKCSAQNGSCRRG